ncbi:MAG: ABC transporter substrate-binding protein, partial [Oscillospiraceae bacterium]|nr:ABC transporter substrate-binding protein [Oscillospiraceae bacterium]
IFTAGWDKLNNHISSGYLIPLNGDPDYGNLLEEYGQDIIANIDPSYIAGNEIDGVLYGISCNKELAANHGLVFNTALVDKYGFDVSTIKTLRDLEPMLEVIKANEPDLLAPFGTNDTGLGFFAPFVELAGDGNMAAQYDDDRDTTVINPYGTPEWYELWEIMYDWYQKGYINKDILQTGSTYEADYQSGLYFVIPQSMKPGKGAEQSVNGVASLEVVLTPTVIRTKDVSGSMIAIVEGSQNPERSMAFLNLLESDPYLINLIVFGLEGTHYNVADADAGIIEVLPAGDERYSMKGNAWMMGNQFMNYITTAEAPDKWEQFIAFNADGNPVVSLGFNYVISPDMMPTLSALINVKTEFNTLFVGQSDPAVAAAEFNAALEAAGLAEYLADVQAQFDAWYAE